MLCVRDFNFNDVESVAELLGDLGYPATVEAVKQRMDVITSTPTFRTFVAEYDGKVAGLLGASKTIAYELDAIMVQVNVLVAKAEFRGLGIGKALMVKAEEWARQEGAASVYLTSGFQRPERKHAHEFYQSIGYEITGYRFVKKF